MNFSDSRIPFASRASPHYQISGKLGEGGMGVVYMARGATTSDVVLIRDLK